MSIEYRRRWVLQIIAMMCRKLELAQPEIVFFDPRVSIAGAYQRCALYRNGRIIVHVEHAVFDAQTPVQIASLLIVALAHDLGHIAGQTSNEKWCDVFSGAVARELGADVRLGMELYLRLPESAPRYPHGTIRARSFQHGFVNAKRFAYEPARRELGDFIGKAALFAIVCYVLS